MKKVIDLRAESENPERMKRLYDLTELGLTIQEAREMHDSELEIEKINNLLREKKRNENQSRAKEPGMNQQVKDGTSNQPFRW